MSVRAFSLKSCTKEGASVQRYIPDMHMYHGFTLPWDARNVAVAKHGGAAEEVPTFYQVAAILALSDNLCH